MLFNLLQCTLQHRLTPPELQVRVLQCFEHFVLTPYRSSFTPLDFITRTSILPPMALNFLNFVLQPPGAKLQSVPFDAIVRVQRDDNRTEITNNVIPRAPLTTCCYITLSCLTSVLYHDVPGHTVYYVPMFVPESAA
jgi:hypothetical protein